jgi:hypothetical protein
LRREKIYQPSPIATRAKRPTSALKIIGALPVGLSSVALMILIVRGHISSEEAKYAIPIWKTFESGLAKPFGKGATGLVCRKRNLQIYADWTEPTLEVSNEASGT